MKQVQKLLVKQMTRREFVRLLGLMILGILGINNTISLLKGSLSHSATQKNEIALRNKKDSGFGTRKFGA